MSIWAIPSVGAVFVLLALNVYVTLWAPPHAPLRSAVRISMLAHLVFAVGDLATYMVTTPAGYANAVTLLYTGTIFVVPAWWAMTIRYAESIGMPFQWATNLWVTAPFLVGGALWLAMVTNNWHGQFVTALQGERNEYHWLWWVHTTFAYTLSICGAALYVRLWQRSKNPGLTTRIYFMVAASVSVVSVNALYVLTPHQLPFDPTPPTFAVCAVLYMFGVYRVGYLSLSRVAIESILDQQPNGILVNDIGGAPVYWNQAAEHLLGANISQLNEPTKDWLNRQLFPNDPERPLVSLQPGQPAALFSLASQPERSLSVRLNSIESWRREARGYSYSFEDVTAAQQRQTEKDRLQERISQAQKLEGLGVLAGGIAHDFNNLLMSISGNTELALLDLSKGNDPTKHLTHLNHANTKAKKLTHHLLTYAGQAAGEFTRLDLATLIEDSRQLLQTTVHHNQCELVLDLQNELFVDGDPIQLQQAAMNLVLNATEAAPGKSIVSVSAGCRRVGVTELASFQYGSRLGAGDYIWLEVCNNGALITPEVIDKMFDPFFSTKSAGRGLGLAAVLGIVRKHNGALRVRSEPSTNPQTSIRILLPLATAGAAPAVPDTSPAVAHQARSRSYVLLVDDDQLVRDVACRFLQGEGYFVLEADSGPKAISIFSEMSDRISLVILDVVMPDMNGPETLRHLRELSPELPVLFVSGHPKGHLDELLKGEQTNYLEKPFTRASLLEQVTARMSPERMSPASKTSPDSIDKT